MIQHLHPSLPKYTVLVNSKYFGITKLNEVKGCIITGIMEKEKSPYLAKEKIIPKYLVLFQSL